LDLRKLRRGMEDAAIVKVSKPAQHKDPSFDSLLSAHELPADCSLFGRKVLVTVKSGVVLPI
jgi:hypothetical protein